MVPVRNARHEERRQLGGRALGACQPWRYLHAGGGLSVYTIVVSGASPSPLLNTCCIYAHLQLHRRKKRSWPFVLGFGVRIGSCSVRGRPNAESRSARSIVSSIRTRAAVVTGHGRWGDVLPRRVGPIASSGLRMRYLQKLGAICHSGSSCSSKGSSKAPEGRTDRR